MENPILKYVAKDDKKSDFFHTSSFGKAQSGSGIGTASSQSFNTRMTINQNRSMVRGYNDSRLVTGTRNPNMRAKTYTPTENTGLRQSGGSMSNRPRGGSSGTGGDSVNRPRMSSPRPRGIQLPKK